MNELHQSNMLAVPAQHVTASISTGGPNKNPSMHTVTPSHPSHRLSEISDDKNNEDEDKASRAAIACTACRARKVKCSGDRPVCVTCAKMGQTCVYTPHAKRKRRTRTKAVDGDGEHPASRLRMDSTIPGPDIPHPHPAVAVTAPSGHLAPLPYSDSTHLQPPSQSGFSIVPPMGVAGPSTYAQFPVRLQDRQWANQTFIPNPNPSDTTFTTSVPRQYQPHSTSESTGIDLINDMLSWEGLGQFQLAPSPNNPSGISDSQPAPVNADASRDPPIPATWNWDEFMAWHPSVKEARVGDETDETIKRSLTAANTSVDGGNGVDATRALAVEKGAEGPGPQIGGVVNGQTHSRSKNRFRVPYFRFFGPTAIAPGYKQVMYDVSAPPSPKGGNHPFNFTPLPSTESQLHVLDDNNEYPHVEALKHLLPLFGQHYSYFFPFLRFDVNDLVPNPDTRHDGHDGHGHGHGHDHPCYLLNIVCALAARYSPLYSKKPDTGPSASVSVSVPSTNPASHAWASKAKEQISKNLSFSSAQMVETLILISWYEFGQDRDGGLWMYSGMGLRMGQDLGLDSLVRQVKVGETSPAEDTNVGDELDAWRLHCSLLMMDAILTIGTGRSGMYLSTNTTIPTFPPVTSTTGISLPDPFGYLAKILVLVDQTARILAKDKVVDMDTQLERAQGDLNEFHTSLPPELRFETSTFQSYASIGQGSSFVLLHLWFHTLIILSYRPSILQSDPPGEDVSERDLAGHEIAASSAKTILDIVTFAELIDPKAVSQPWINYPLYTAGRTFLSQSLLATISGPADGRTQDARSAGQVHLAKIARANFQRVVSILTNLQHYWSGVRYIRSALLQKAEGVHSITLIDPDGDATGDVQNLPSPLAALWNAGSKQGNKAGVVGLSFTGTMNSPTDNFYSLLFPSSAIAPLLAQREVSTSGISVNTAESGSVGT